LLLHIRGDDLHERRRECCQSMRLPRLRRWQSLVFRGQPVNLCRGRAGAQYVGSTVCHTAPKRPHPSALAGTAPIHLVLLLRRQALRPVQHATAAAPDPTTAPCHAPATTRTPACTATAVCAANATVNPAAAVAYPQRPHPPAAPTGPTVGTFGARPAARRSAAPDARYGVLAHADWHCPNRHTESRLLHGGGGAPACPNAPLAVPELGACAFLACPRQAWAARHSHRK
jgi:hypothetical protein